MRAVNTSIDDILRRSATVAVVGISESAARASHGIGLTLIRRGYTVIPVNPLLDTWQGMKVWPDLRSIPVRVDLVCIFRRPEHVPAVVEEAVAIGATAVWMQPGAEEPGAAQAALEAGLDVVMGRCIAVELALG